MARIILEAGESTEELTQFVTRELDDTILDAIDLKREIAETQGLASEPITTTVVLTLTPIAAALVLRIVERWLENFRQEKALKLVLEGFSISDEAGKAAAELASKHTEVSIKYGPAPVKLKS